MRAGAMLRSTFMMGHLQLEKQLKGLGSKNVVRKEGEGDVLLFRPKGTLCPSGCAPRVLCV